MKEPCTICENFIVGVDCDNSKCPIFIMKKENETLKDEIRKLKLEMSYMTSYNTIGDCHEMGAW